MRARLVIPAILIVIAAAGAFVIRFLQTDSVVHYAKESDPLDGKNVYIIRHNDGLVDSDGKTIVPSAVFYVVLRPEEANGIFPYGLNGKAIGKSDVDLSPYLGKKVHIIGDYYDGQRKFLSTEGVPNFLLESKMAVVHVKQISLAN